MVLFKKCWISSIQSLLKQNYSMNDIIHPEKKGSATHVTELRVRKCWMLFMVSLHVIKKLRVRKKKIAARQIKSNS